MVNDQLLVGLKQRLTPTLEMSFLISLKVTIKKIYPKRCSWGLSQVLQNLQFHKIRLDEVWMKCSDHILRGPCLDSKFCSNVSLFRYIGLYLDLHIFHGIPQLPHLTFGIVLFSFQISTLLKKRSKIYHSEIYLKILL